MQPLLGDSELSRNLVHSQLAMSFQVKVASRWLEKSSHESLPNFQPLEGNSLITCLAQILLDAPSAGVAIKRVAFCSRLSRLVGLVCLSFLSCRMGANGNTGVLHVHYWGKSAHLNGGLPNYWSSLTYEVGVFVVRKLDASSLFQHWYFKEFLSNPKVCPSAQTQRKKGCAFGLSDLPSITGEAGSSCCRTWEFHLVVRAVEMQGPHAADPGEEVTGLHRMLVGLRGLDTTTDILYLSLNVRLHLKKRAGTM